ncbi:MAG: exosortase/archaeosortase family protein [Chloroflexi bacterium]|nr:exosortase/archaeosortase family protein [Chloroflexota bacterium]
MLRPQALRSLVWPLATTLVTALLYAPTWRWLVVRWWYDPNYGHAFLVLPVALGLVWLQRKSLAATPRQPSYAGLALVAVAVAVHVLALARDNALLSAFTLPFTAAGLIWFLYGPALLKKLWFPLAFLLFMLPFPWGEGVDARLQAITTRLAGGLLGLLGVKAYVLGAQITLAGSTFEVGAACSGFRSTMALLTVGTVTAYLLSGPAWARVLLVLAIVPIALASNLVRIVSLLLVALRFGTRVAMDYYHWAAGMVLFLCAMLLFLGLARLLGCVRPASAA